MEEQPILDLTIQHSNTLLAVDHEASVYAVLRPAEFERLVEAVATRVVEKLQAKKYCSDCRYGSHCLSPDCECGCGKEKQ
jgi:hypothetical protein